MNKIFTTLLFIIFSISFSKAQVLLSQDFSSSTNVDNYVGSGIGQLGIDIYAPTTGDGFASKSIVNSKLQFDLKSTYAGAYMYGAGGQIDYPTGTAKVVKLQFKLNYHRTSEDASKPKSLIMWLQYTTGIYFGTNNSSDYFITNKDYDYFGRTTDNHSQAYFYVGASENQLSGEHLITILINYTSNSLTYNSVNLYPHSFSIYVDGKLQGTGHGYRSDYVTPGIHLSFQTAYYNYMYTYEWQNQTAPMSVHTVTVDDLLIEDITTAALPVKLVDFAVSSEKGSALLQWRTAEEVNSDRFEIEHSMNAKDWKVLDQVSSAGDTKELVKYQYIHTNPSVGINYYRLKMVDRDGTFAYSAIKSILNNEENNLTIFPNPVAGRLFIESNYLNKITSVQINDIQGKQVIAPTNNIKNGIAISSLSPGSYIVIIQQEDGSKSSKRFFVQK